MSPFEAASDEVAAQVRGLSVRSAVGLFWAGSVALTRDYVQWCSAVPADPEIERLAEAQVAAREIALGRGPASAVLLAEVESRVPSGPSDVAGFTAAQDCWICVDSALRLALGRLEAEDGAWFLLEPAFHRVTERLSGVYDTGSADQEDTEREALDDPVLAGARQGLDRAVRLLARHPEPDEDVLAECLVSVSAIAAAAE